jgi:hypothetical protein
MLVGILFYPHRWVENLHVGDQTCDAKIKPVASEEPCESYPMHGGIYGLIGITGSKPFGDGDDSLVVAFFLPLNKDFQLFRLFPCEMEIRYGWEATFVHVLWGYPSMCAPLIILLVKWRCVMAGTCFTIQWLLFLSPI